MKLILSIGFLLCFSVVSKSAEITKEDLLGRINLTEQAEGKIQGIIRIRQKTNSDPASKVDLVAELMLKVKGQGNDGINGNIQNCSARFVQELEVLRVVCTSATNNTIDYTLSVFFDQMSQDDIHLFKTGHLAGGALVSIQVHNGNGSGISGVEVDMRDLDTAGHSAD